MGRRKNCEGLQFWKMDEYSMRKAAGALKYSRKASSGLVLRDSADKKGDRNTQLCSRAGCSSRVNLSKDNQIGCSDKAKTARHPVRLSNSGKEVIGSSSRTPLAPNGPRKPNSNPQKKLSSHQVADSESSSISEESEVSEPVIGSDHSQVRFINALIHDHVSGEASSSSSIPNKRSGKKTMRRPELGIRHISTGSCASSAYKLGTSGVKNGASTSKLKNFKCNSINDVVSPGCSSSLPSDLNPDSNRVMGRKRIGEAEVSLVSRGKKINGPVLDDRRPDRSHSGISIASSRRTRNNSFTRDNDGTSFGIRRSGMSHETNGSSSENRLPSQVSSSRRMNAHRRPGSSHANINSNGSLASFDASFSSSFLNTESVGHYNLDGIAEMLLALDGIEQDEDPNYEHLLSVETNLFMSGISFHDQHRDMRLDIDNMSYEELLALEDRIGTVSTALTEEALEKCLKKSTYEVTEEGAVVGEGDDIKCVICQEEYEEGKEVGKLGCDHQYHVECIEKWLGMKNWCPICKVSAAHSPSRSPCLVSEDF